MLWSHRICPERAEQRSEWYVLPGKPFGIRCQSEFSAAFRQSDEADASADSSSVDLLLQIKGPAFDVTGGALELLDEPREWETLTNLLADPIRLNLRHERRISFDELNNHARALVWSEEGDFFLGSIAAGAPVRWQQKSEYVVLRQED